MNFSKWLLYKSGNTSLSNLQMAGLAAAVVVAGVAVYQLFSSPADVNPDTIFSSQDDDVIYVVNSGGGAYQGGTGSANYGEGGEVRSGLLTRASRDMQLMDLDAQRGINKPSSTALEQDEENVNNVQGGATNGGLGGGLGGNFMGGSASQGADPMSSAQDSIAQIQAMMAAQQAALANGEVPGAAGAAEAAAGAAENGKFGSGHAWGEMNSGIARANGSNLNSTPLQGDGGAGSDRSGSLGGSEGAGSVSPSQLGDGSRAPKLQLGRDVMLSNDRLGQGKDLESIRRASAKVAANKYRSDNEGSRIFLASSKTSAGISLGGGEQIGAGGSMSDDFKDISGALGGLSSFVGDFQSTYEQYQSDANNLVTKLRQFRNKLIGCSFVPLIGKALCIPANNTIKGHIESFNEKWKDYEVEANNTKGRFADKIAGIRSDMWDSFWAIPGLDIISQLAIYGESNTDVNAEDGVIHTDENGDGTGMANDDSGTTGNTGS